MVEVYDEDSSLVGSTGEQLSRLSAIVESCEDAIIGKDLQGIVTSWNASAERIFGFTASEMIGRSLSKIIPPNRSEDLFTILGKIRRGERVDHFETERLRKDGRRIHVSLTVSPIKTSSGRVIGASKIARDVTARVELEAQREQLLGIAQRALAEAEAANRSKDEFLAMLSHELRNPLAALRNAIYTARLDSRQQERALEIATRQANLLTELVDDLLDLVRIGHSRILLNKRILSLTESVDRAIETVGPLIEERRHVLSVVYPNEQLRIEGDPARLEQIVSNLLRNAVQYTNPVGRIEVVVERDGKTAAVRIRDNGTGIAPEALQHIFGLFVQGGEEPQRVIGGLGIGLAIVRELALLHGGRVEARSGGLGHGAEFVLHLPLFEGDAQEAPQHSSSIVEAGPEDSLYVLVVEDNIDAAEGLLMLLQVFGHRPRVVHDAPSAIALAKEKTPDVMLIDVGLPGMDGYELSRALREIPALVSVPLIATTGFGQEDDRRRAFAAGFTHHLTKPTDPQRLRRLLAQFEPLKPFGEEDK